MRLFELKDWTLSVREEAWGLSPFKKILKRDKGRNKETAVKEMLFIYYYADIKSDYLIISDEKLRTVEIVKDINLPEDWKLDDTMSEAIKFYEERSVSVIGRLYLDALKSTGDVSKYLRNTDSLLAERDGNGKPVIAVSVITGALKQLKVIMQDLKAAEKEVIKEQVETEGRMKGSREMSMFEEGLNFEE